MQIWRPKIGERVRVRVSAECQYCVDIRYPECARLALSQDGRTATVVEFGHSYCCRPLDLDQGDPAHRAHDIWVKWDERRPTDEQPWGDGWLPNIDAHYAPQELEPISSYVCCACAQTVRREDQDDHSCGPCQCPQGEEP
jgi:hypothetical protein